MAVQKHLVFACRRHVEIIRDGLEAQEHFFSSPLSSLLKKEAHMALKSMERPIPAHPISLKPFVTSALSEVLRLSTGCCSLLETAGNAGEAWPDLEKAVENCRVFLREIARSDPTLFPEPAWKKRKEETPLNEWVVWNEESSVKLRNDGIYLSVTQLDEGWVSRIAGVFVQWNPDFELAKSAAEFWGDHTFGAITQPSSPGNM
jgi:hypothetical protein